MNVGATGGRPGLTCTTKNRTTGPGPGDRPVAPTMACDRLGPWGGLIIRRWGMITVHPFAQEDKGDVR